MKSISYYSIILCSTLIFTGCKKDGTSTGNGSNNLKIPTLTTTKESAIMSNSAQSGGSITSDGGSAIIARGVCWSDVNSSPTIADNKTVDGTGSGTFTSAITGLTPYHGYDVRAYATNSNGTAYGNKISFLTLPGVTIVTGPMAETVDKQRTCITQITIHGFTSGALPVTETGICWGTTQNPTTANNKIYTGPVSDHFALFTSILQFGINSTYYIRGFAITSAGTTYGNQLTYTTTVDIGLSHGGGVIFYVDNTGQHGLISATFDQGSGIPWAPGNLFTTQTTATSITDGKGNTTKIINKYGNSGTYAAKLCRDFRGGGFTDWYLPSHDEANLMKSYQEVIGGFHGNTFLTSYYYWSSTEYNNFSAWDHDFNPRYFLVQALQKTTTSYVRSIRSF